MSGIDYEAPCPVCGMTSCAGHHPVSDRMKELELLERKLREEAAHILTSADSCSDEWNTAYTVSTTLEHVADAIESVLPPTELEDGR